MNFYGEGPIFLAVIQQYLRIIIRQWFRVTREKTTIKSSRFQKKLRIKSSRFQYEKRNEKSYRHIFSDFRWFSVIFSNKKRQITSSTVRRSVSSRFFRKKQRIFAVWWSNLVCHARFVFVVVGMMERRTVTLTRRLRSHAQRWRGCSCCLRYFYRFVPCVEWTRCIPRTSSNAATAATSIAASTAVDGRPNQRF